MNYLQMKKIIILIFHFSFFILFNLFLIESLIYMLFLFLHLLISHSSFSISMSVKFWSFFIVSKSSINFAQLPKSHKKIIIIISPINYFKLLKQKFWFK